MQLLLDLKLLKKWKNLKKKNIIKKKLVDNVLNYVKQLSSVL